MRYFDGYEREDGRVGTRNYVAIISGVNCSASVSQFVKDKFRDVQRDFPNIDGVLAVTHKSGCGTKLFGEDHLDRKSTRLNSSHLVISYAVFCLKKKKHKN